MQAKRTRSLVPGLALLLGCAGTPPADPAGTDTEGTAETSRGTAGVDDSTGPVTNEGSSSDGIPLDVDVEIFTHPSQPMVVDLVFSAPDLAVSVEHASDPGVRSGPIPSADGETWIRLRGLAPQTEHTVTWSVQAPDGQTDEGTYGFETLAPLPGFIPSFTVEGRGRGYGDMVMFDLMDLGPGSVGAALFVVDTDGITRWYTTRNDGAVGPAAVYTGATVRDDGSVLLLRNVSLMILDELGAEVTTMTPRDLGLPGLHHDVLELPSGNFLALSVTFRDIDYRDIGLTHVAGDLLVEITPEGEIVWQWDSFDHLDPLRRREGFDDQLFDPATGQAGQDWTHGNGIVHDPEAGTILLSFRHQDWVVAIDAETGDVLWRLGEEGDFTLTAGRWPYHQHSPQWQDDGTLLLYDNGLGNPSLDDALETSRAVRYALDLEAMTATEVWEDEAEDFMSPIAGDADRLPDGSILVTDSSVDMEMGFGASYGRIREIDERTSASPQWSISTALGSFVYRCVATDRLPGEPRP